jgi:ATP-dependent protease ClpP protease subunit
MNRIAFFLLALAPACAFASPPKKTAHARPEPLALLAYLESDVDDNSVQPVIDTIEKANELGNRVIVEIDTNGGDVDAGFTLAKAIERAKRPVTCVVDGKAYSMGSFILEACARRIMTKRSTVMIHEVGMDGPNSGTHEWSFLDAAAWLRVRSLALFEHYAHRIPGLTAADIVARTSGGRCIWLEWREAKALGAVDAVVDTVADVK